MSQELVLTESRTLRSQYADRTDVLDKVKPVVLMPGTAFATAEQVADYYEVSSHVIQWHMRANGEELRGNGYDVLESDALRELKAGLKESDSASPLISKNTRSLAVFPRRAILNVGQMIIESDVAREVRSYLLDAEEDAPHRTEYIEAMPGFLGWDHVSALARSDHGLNVTTVQLRDLLKSVGVLRRDGQPHKKCEDMFRPSPWSARWDVVPAAVPYLVHLARMERAFIEQRQAHVQLALDMAGAAFTRSLDASKTEDGA